MFWIDPQGNQHDEKPQRVRLPDMTTRTSEAVTNELLMELGWTLVQDPVVDLVDTITGA